jgi:hypothetical protein
MISVSSSPALSSPREPSSPMVNSPPLTTSLPPTSELLDSLHAVSPSPVISLPVSPVRLDRSPSPCWLMADLKFGRCVTPTSLPASLPTSRLLSPVVRLLRISTDAVFPENFDISSSSEDEAVEAKRKKLDPDYQPSTASGSPLTTADQSQNVSEQEEEEPNETDTEDDESWQPSGTTSPEIISSPEDD